MYPDFKISQIRASINKEKVYMFMLSFILLFNAWIIFAQKVPGAKAGLAQKELLGIYPATGKAGGEFDPKVYEKISWREVLEREKRIPIFVSLLGFIAIFVFSLGLFLDIRILMAKIKKREIFKNVGRHLRVKWEIWDIFKLAIIFVFLGYIIHMLEAALFSPSAEKDALTFSPLLNTGIMDLALLAFIIYFVKVKFRQNLSAIGLKIKGAAKNIFLAILGYIAFLPVLTFLLLLLMLLAALLNYQPPQQAIFKLFLQEKRLWFLIYSTAMVAILGPFVEEAFFRGFAYNAIKKRWGARTSALLTALVFAGLHGTLFGFLPIMALGLLLVYIYEKTGSLLPSITIHMLHNSIMVGFLFLARYLLRFAQ